MLRHLTKNSKNRSNTFKFSWILAMEDHLSCRMFATQIYLEILQMEALIADLT